MTTSELPRQIYKQNGALEQRTLREVGAVHRMLVTPFPLTEADRANGIQMAALQEYEATNGGWVASHKEDSKVKEIYYPLSGMVRAERNNERFVLEGNIKGEDIPALFTAQYGVTYDAQVNLYMLSVHLLDSDKTIQIPGFTIPGGTQHKTTGIPNQHAVFFAMKIEESM